MKQIRLLFLLMFISTSIFAQSYVGGVHLNSAPDARSAGMGNTGVATSPDEFSLFWNPAKLVLIKNNYAGSLSYSPPPANGSGRSGYAAGYKQIHDNLAIGMSLNYFSMGSISLRNEIGNDIGIYAPNEFGIDISVSKKFTREFSMGYTARYIKSDMFEFTYNGAIQSAHAIAVDVGALYKHMISDKSITIGLMLSNLGNKLNYGNGYQKFLPSNLRVGVNYDTGGDNPFNIGLELNKLLVTPQHDSSIETGVLSNMVSSFGTSNGGLKNFNVAMGGEYTLASQFMLRSGLNFQNTEIGNLSFATMGFGFIANKLRFNMSYAIPINNQQFLTSNRFKLSLGMMF